MGYNVLKIIGKKKIKGGEETHYQKGIGENIARELWWWKSIKYQNGTQYFWNGTEDVALHTVSDWMNSPGHRGNILNNKYDVEGIGVALSDPKTNIIMVTQNFF